MQGNSSNSLFSVRKGPNVKVKIISGANTCSSETQTRLCGICHKTTSAYICPQCNIPYCNLKCYRGPGHINCTEKFYKRQITNSLQEQPKQDDSEFLSSLRQRVDESLKTTAINTESSDTNEDISPTIEAPSQSPNVGYDIEDECEDIDVDHLNELNHLDHLSIDDLNDSERQHFFNSITSGNLSKDIKIWKPWWDNTSIKIMSTDEVEVESSQVESSSSDYETLLNEIQCLPDFSTVSTKPASPIMKYLLTDILFSYCYIILKFNGDLYNMDVIHDTYHLLLNSSLVLKSKDTKHENMYEVVHGSCSLLASYEVNKSKFDINHILTIFKHVSILLTNRKFILCALKDCYNLLTNEEACLHKKNKKKSNKNLNQSKEARKIWFFMLWANGVGEHHFIKAHDELLKTCEEYSTSTSTCQDETPTNYQISNSFLTKKKK